MKSWFILWLHQAMSWTNVELSSNWSFDINACHISRNLSFKGLTMDFKVIYKFHLVTSHIDFSLEVPILLRPKTWISTRKNRAYVYLCTMECDTLYIHRVYQIKYAHRNELEDGCIINHISHHFTHIQDTSSRPRTIHCFSNIHILPYYIGNNTFINTHPSWSLWLPLRSERVVWPCNIKRYRSMAR